MNRSKPPPRLYVPEPIPAHGVCLVPPEQSHHLSHVLRLAAGDAVTVFDGHGSEYEATIARVAKGGVTLNLSEPRTVDRESPLDITLAQGIADHGGGFGGVRRARHVCHHSAGPDRRQSRLEQVPL